MTREEEMLQAAAETFKVCRSSFVKSIERIWVTAFSTGAFWADRNQQNVWHDPDEEPKDAKDLLIIDNKAHVWVGYVSHTNGAPRWKTYLQKGKVAKWAYIEDLLPKQFGNSKQVKGGEQ